MQKTFPFRKLRLISLSKHLVTVLKQTVSNLSHQGYAPQVQKSALSLCWLVHKYLERLPLWQFEFLKSLKCLCWLFIQTNQCSWKFKAWTSGLARFKKMPQKFKVHVYYHSKVWLVRFVFKVFLKMHLVDKKSYFEILQCKIIVFCFNYISHII